MRMQGLLWCLLFQILFVARMASTQCHNDQRLLLLELKHKLAFDSEFSTKLVNWNRSMECCNWDGVACDASGHVVGLNLANESISGGIENSTGLFGLQYLQELNLASNDFHGAQIPRGIQNLTHLSYLNLSYSDFGGQIPTEVSMLRNLVILDLSTSFDKPLKLYRTLHMFVQNLTRLEELYLDYVSISDKNWCRALSSSLPHLRILSLSSCGLSGPLDSSLLGLHSLSAVHLDYNNLSETIMEGITNISSLTTLSLKDCSLRGIVSENIFQVSTLQTLDLSYNLLLSGTIPDSIGNLKMLSEIDLSGCKFTGMIPSSISNLKELVYMNFFFNYFTGSIPSFSMSSKLTYLDLSFNKLNGTIPPSLFGLPSLRQLSLSNNKFSGQINEFFISNPSILHSVDLSNNQLKGHLPDSFFKLEGLNVALFSFNMFNGSLKLETFHKLSNLTKLALGHNNFFVDTSNVSSSWLPQLEMLHLASCNLYKFPDLRNLSYLINLDLSNNYIAGEIPSWIWNIGGGVETLNLSSNFFVGLQKPVNMTRWLNLLDLHSNRMQGALPVLPESARYADYSNNNFQQPIPINIRNSNPNLEFFSLANNGLNGTIPASLCNAIYLQVLDLSDNHLNGSIPPCLLGDLPNLGVLKMARNYISGHIADVFSVNCSLEILDLSNNKLGGKIQPSLANCKSLKIVNVGNNDIDGTFPCWLKSVSGLRALILRNNNFYGNLGCFGVNESWPNLQIIDIASNNFHGALSSRYFSSWRGMMIDNDSQFDDNQVSFMFLNPVMASVSPGILFYHDIVKLTFKGLEWELVKILPIFTAIDFSGNKFSGEIPQTIGDLSSLYVLNLSNNAFTGRIPNTIGKLKQLGSLDLSTNLLFGKIPEELIKMNFLSVLNLSYNKLSGRIPTGTQFQTFPASSFVGNPKLYGFPLEAIRDSNGPGVYSAASLNKKEYDWQLIITGAGYGFGLSLVVLPVAMCKQWRKYYIKQLDQFLVLIFPRFILANSGGGRRRRGH